MTDHDKDVVFFVVWLLDGVSRAWGKSTAETYRLLQDADIVNGYLFPCYDVLHTMGKEALIEDVTLLARKRGVIA